MVNFLIVNNAKLPYQLIGKVIDDYLNNYEEDTFYAGKTEIIVIDYQERVYSITIRYLKRYIEFRFMNYLEEE